MVEVMIFNRKIIGILLIVFSFFGTASGQEVRPRIMGLESNEEYLSLLRKDLAMQAREDSVVRRVETVRKQFRDDPGNRSAYADEILRLEEQIFSLRNAKGKLIERINAIEQDWVLNRLAAGGEVSQSGQPQAPALRSGVPDLVANRILADNLPPADYAALRRAQSREVEAAALIGRYTENYNELLGLREEYAASRQESEASVLYDKYGVLEGINASLGDSLAAVWNYIFDNKTFAYGYLLEKLHREELLAREVEHIARTQRQIASLEGQYASDALTAYFLQKQALLRYEQAVAEALGLGLARDSLAREAASLHAADLSLPKMELRQRYFLDYEPLGFSVPARYNARNPIPRSKQYEHGTIYRILLGTFRTKQAVGIFKGAYPLSFLPEEDGRFSYYAGAFATREEADDARRQLLDKGFRRPEIVVWTDGTAENLTRREAEGLTKSYRVEIAGVPALSDAMRTVIRERAEGYELSRIGQDTFAVGIFADRALAEQLADALSGSGEGIEIKVTEIDG